MSKELEPWGGELRMPRLLRKLLHRPDVPRTAQRRHEKHTRRATDTPLMAVDRAILGGFAQAHPGNREQALGAGAGPAGAGPAHPQAWPVLHRPSCRSRD